MRNFEVPTRFSVPGLTASHDSEWFEFRCCDPQVPGKGLVEPGGTGYPPPSTGSLAATFVPTRPQDGLARLAIAKIPAAATAATSPTRILFTVAPLRLRYRALDVGRQLTRAGKSKSPKA